MSLINDMLRDLEARRSDELKRQNLQGEVRPLPPINEKSRRAVPLVVAVILLLLMAGLAGWHFLVPVPSVVSKLPIRRAAEGTNHPRAPAMPVVVASSATTTRLETTTTLDVPASTTTSLRPVVPHARPASVGSRVTTTTLRTQPPSAASSWTREKSPVLPGDKGVKPGVGKATIPLPAAQTAPAATAGRIEVKSVLATPRERADADFRQAQVLLASGRPAEAREILASALRHDERHAPARQLLVRQFLEEKRLPEAMALIEQGLALQPGQINWAMTLARLRVDQNDLAAAERILARHAAHAVGNADYLGFHAHLHYRLGHLHDARTLYREAAKIDAAEGRWWFGLAVVLEAEGKTGEARDAFRQALATGTLNDALSAQAMQRIR